jgi:hypothetical protein
VGHTIASQAHPFLFAKNFSIGWRNCPGVSDFKISLVTVFLFSLTLPFLIKQINGLYDIHELTDLLAYCYLHADRAAQGQKVVNDLVESGSANSTYYNWSCSKIGETLRAERQAESDRIDSELEREQAR